MRSLEGSDSSFCVDSCEAEFDSLLGKGFFPTPIEIRNYFLPLRRSFKEGYKSSEGATARGDDRLKTVTSFRREVAHKNVRGKLMWS